MAVNHQTSEELRAFFRRAQEIYPELFNMAHAICGNYDLAEYALRSAILSVWQQNTGGMGFREKLRWTLKNIALRELLASKNETAEYTWSGLPQAMDGDSALLKLASAEPSEVQRILLLRHGCDFSPARIAKITGFTAGQVRSILNRFETRSCRKLSPRLARRYDQLMHQAMEDALNHPAGELPDPSAIYRAFEAEAAESTVSSHRFSRILGHGALVLMALLCAAFFWLFAVISAPPVMEAPASNPPAAQTEIPPAS